MQPISSIVRRHPRVLPTDAELALVGRPVEQHALLLVAASVAGFAVPTLLLWLLRTAGLIGLAWYAPLAISLAGAALGPVLVHSATIDEATRIRSDLRYQVSAYLDVVTMLLAGNTGYEGALEQAAHAGDGRLFVELRRRMREAGARGASLTDALRNTGRDLGLDELEQIASTAVERRRGRAGRPHPLGEVRHVAFCARHRAGVGGPTPHESAHDADRRHGADLHGARHLSGPQPHLTPWAHRPCFHPEPRQGDTTMRLMIQAATQQLYATLLRAVPDDSPDAHDDPAADPTSRDRGAVSLEQVLWFIAVGVSVAVVATILWTQIIDTANETDNIDQPTAP
ncbi:MAG: hypothetical protein R2697_18680 [Ilumatobacteraceae bacterium]